MTKEERNKIHHVFKTAQEVDTTSVICNVKMELELQTQADIAYQLTRIADAMETANRLAVTTVKQ